MEKHINSVEVTNSIGEKITLTKTSTHRDYQFASVAQFQSGEQDLMVWHLTEEAAHKYVGSKAARDLAGYWAKESKDTLVNIMVVPVTNEVIRTGRDAKKAEDAAPAPEVTEEAPAAPQKVTGSGNCKCGCGDIVGGMGKSQYLPGHDAKHVSVIRKAILSQPEADLPKLLAGASKLLSDKLFQKLVRQLSK